MPCIMSLSAVMDWELVCERKELRATAQAIFMTGVMIGSYAFGWMSDAWGRKLAFFISLIMQVRSFLVILLQTVFGVISGLVTNYWLFVFLRMVVGATTSGVFLVAYVLAMEMVGPQYRVVAGTLCQYYYTVGYLTMAGLAFLLHHSWQLLQIVRPRTPHPLQVLTLPSVLFLSYWWIVPESVRWQLSTGRCQAEPPHPLPHLLNHYRTQGSHEAAREQIVKVARRNGTEVGEEKLDKMIGETSWPSLDCSV